MHPPWRLISYLLAAYLLTLATGSMATEWFLSPTGNDSSGNGSFDNPYKTLGHLLNPEFDIVQAGDIITLRGTAGHDVYNETEVRLRKPLTLRSYEGEWAVISCPIDLEDGVCIQFDPEASGSRLSRLEVTGGTFYALFFQTNWDSRNAQQESGASNIIIEDCKVHDTGRDAIKITPKSNNITIRRCEIYNTGRIYPGDTPLDDKNAEGIDNVNGSGMLVEDSYIHDIATTGLYFKGGAADVIVQRNRIERTGLGGILVGFDTSPDYFDTTLNPNYYESIRGIVRNNVVRDTGYAGIGLYAAQDAIVANNTIVHTATLGHAAIYFGVTLQDFEPMAKRPPNVNPMIRNNLVIQNGGDCVHIRWANEISENGLYSLIGPPGTDYNWFYNKNGPCNFTDTRPGNPLSEGGTFEQWVNLEHVDTHSLTGAIDISAEGHLLPNSPAIDKGIALPQVTEDIDQHPRVSLFDMGADEVADKINQTITFTALADKTFGEGPFTVSATASSSLTVSFTATGHCSIAETTVTLLSAGSCTITAAQAGNALYTAASEVKQTFAIIATPMQTQMLQVSVQGEGSIKSLPAGIECGADCQESYLANTSVTLTATPTAGNTFTGWSGACSGLDVCQVNMNQMWTVMATFTAVNDNLLPICAPATLSPELNLQVPVISFGSEIGWAEMIFVPELFAFKMVQYGVFNSSPPTCQQGAVLTSNVPFTLSLPTVTFGNQSLWANLEFAPTPPYPFLFKVMSYGVK